MNEGTNASCHHQSVSQSWLHNFDLLFLRRASSVTSGEVVANTRARRLSKLDCDFESDGGGC